MASTTPERIAGALFDFCGYITTVEEFVVGSSQTPHVLMEHMNAWAKLRGLDLNEADVESWNQNLGLVAMKEATEDDSPE